MKLSWIAVVAAVTFFGALALTQNGSAADKIAPAAQRGASVDATTLIGSWGDNGDCGADVVFMRDGRFHSYTGGDGRWTLTGDRLVMAGDGGVFELGVHLIDADHIQTISADGSINISNRCR